MKFNKVQGYLNNFFWLFSTYLLAPYFYFLIFLLARRSPKGEGGRRRTGKNQKLKILVIQTGKIGDLVCITSVFREIKKKFPASYLTAMIISRAKGILKNNPYLNEITLIDEYPGIREKLQLIRKLRKEKYDWMFNLTPDSFSNTISFWSLVPNRVTTTYKYSGEITRLLSIFNNYRLEFKRHAPILKHHLALLKFLGIEDCSEKKEIFIQAEEEKKALNFLKTQNINSNDLLVGISVTAGVKLKEWEPSRFAKLADRLTEKLKAKIIFIGSADDHFRVEEVQKMMQNSSINASGLFKLFELPALLKNMKLFISVDTGPIYIADALKVPVIDIAGPADMREQAPSGPQSKIIQKDIYCVPCSFVFAGARHCKEGHLRCLKEINPEEVFDVARLTPLDTS